MRFFVSTSKIDAHLFNDIVSNDAKVEAQPFLLFLENSTRTKESFKMALNQSNLVYSDISLQESSHSKGEAFHTTLITLAAMAEKPLFIMRLPFEIRSVLPFLPSNAYVINAGDSANEHPTQAMIDIFTISKATGLSAQNLKDLTVTISGDILHSRVARSNIFLMKNLGININLVSPISFMPHFSKTFYESLGCKVHYELSKEIIEQSDVIMQLRTQTERMKKDGFSINTKAFKLNAERVSYMKKSAFIMHPGPINDGCEITYDIAYNHPQSLVQKQVANGPIVRKAIISHVLSSNEA